MATRARRESRRSRAGSRRATTVAPPALLGSRCAECGTYAFPAEARFCRNPDCGSTTFETVELSRRGRIWSYTDARYQPPPPYVAADPYVPFCLAAVELAAEKLVVMGQVVPGVTVDDLTVGDEVELVVDTLYSEDGTRLPGVEVAPARPRRRRDRRGGLSDAATTRRWRCSVPACTSGASGAGPSSSTGWPPPATPWPTPGSAGATCSSSRGPTPSATATRASCRGRPSPRRSAGPGARVSSVYAACASGAVAIANARAQILAGLCDVALVVGADTTPKGFFAPVGGGDRKDDPDWLRFHLLGATNPTYFALYAAPAHGPLRRHRGGLRTGQGEERAARAGQPLRAATARRSRSTRCWPRRWWPTRCASSRSAPPPTAGRPWCSRAWSSPGATPAAPSRSSRSTPSRPSRRRSPTP